MRRAHPATPQCVRVRFVLKQSRRASLNGGSGRCHLRHQIPMVVDEGNSRGRGEGSAEGGSEGEGRRSNTGDTSASACEASSAVMVLSRGA